MRETDSAEITREGGVATDSRGKPGGRQVTVLAAEDWQAACDAIGKQLPWTSRRANVLIEGIALKDSAGATIMLGDVELLVTGETDPCSRMDEIEPGLQAALAPDWRGGVCCRVVRGGNIAKGTSVRIENHRV